MTQPKTNEKCAICGRILDAHQDAFIDGDQILCGLCYGSKQARATRLSVAVAPRSHVLAATSTPVPRYRILTLVAHIIMYVGLFAGLCVFGLGLFLFVSSGLSAAAAPRPANPFLDPRTSVLAASATASIFVMLYGLIIPLMPVAFGQLLLAIRDIAINSFHSRNALARLP